MPSEEHTNIYYFRHINSLGGIETFFYELAKKYHDYDLVIYYKTGDKNQIKRLKKYVRCIEYKGQKIKCKKAFFNFNLDIIDEVEAEEKVLVIHGNYKDLKTLPKDYEKVNKVIAVSKDSAKAFEELTGIKCEVCYNPYTKEEVNPVINMVVASRLVDKCKGEDLLTRLIYAMDDYAAKNNRQYNLLVFSDIKKNISENVSFRKPRLDIESYLASADLVIQLSKTEGFGYTTCIAQTYGTKCVLTPCPVYKELGITNAIWLNFDGSNIKEVVEKIFNVDYSKKEYKLPNDRWNELLIESKSDYKEEIEVKNHKVKVIRLTPFTDVEENVYRKKDDIFLCTKERYEYLKENNAVELLEIIKTEEPVKEIVKEPVKEEVKTEKKKKSKVK